MCWDDTSVLCYIFIEGFNGRILILDMMQMFWTKLMKIHNSQMLVLDKFRDHTLIRPIKDKREFRVLYKYENYPSLKYEGAVNLILMTRPIYGWLSVPGCFEMRPNYQKRPGPVGLQLIRPDLSTNTNILPPTKGRKKKGGNFFSPTRHQSSTVQTKLESGKLSQRAKNLIIVDFSFNSNVTRPHDLIRKKMCWAAGAGG